MSIQHIAFYDTHIRFGILLQLRIVPGIRHIPESSFSCISGIIGRSKDYYIRPVLRSAGKCLSQHIIVSIVIRLNNFQFNSCQFFPFIDPFFLTICQLRKCSVYHNCNLFRFLYIIRSISCLCAGICLSCIISRIFRRATTPCKYHGTYGNRNQCS